MKNLIFAIYTIFLLIIFIRLPHLLWSTGVIPAWFSEKGLIIYKDFLHFYFPLSTFFLIPFMKIANWNLQVEPFLSLVIALASIGIIFQIARKYFGFWGTFISLSFFSLLFYFFTTAIQYTVEAMVGLIIILLLYRIFSYFYKPSTISRSSVLVDGFLIAAAGLFDQVATPLLGIIYFCFIYLIFKTSLIKKEKAYQLLFLTLGVILPFVLTALYFWHLNAFSDFLDNNIFYYLNYLAMANSQAHSTNLPWGDIFIFYAPLLASLPLVLSIKKNKQNFSANRKIFCFLNFAAISTIPTIIFSVFHPHHFLYALPVLAVLGGLAVDYTVKLKSRIIKIFVVVIWLLFAQQIISNVLPWYWQKVQNSQGPLVLANDLTTKDTMYQPVSWVKNNTPQDATLLVAGDTLFYLKADRLPANKYFTVLPWHYKQSFSTNKRGFSTNKPLDRAMSVIQASRPSYWVISRSYLKRVSSPDGWNSPEITEFIESELKNCYSEEILFPEWEIWKRKFTWSC